MIGRGRAVPHALDTDHVVDNVFRFALDPGDWPERPNIDAGAFPRWPALG